MSLVVAVTTVARAEDARRLADLAVAQRLAACVQMEPITSVYVWQGAVQREPELRLLFKTTRARLPALREAVLAAHPYELPAFHAVEALDASAAYAAWVAAQTTPQA